jgi:hypothetical protein
MDISARAISLPDRPQLGHLGHYDAHRRRHPWPIRHGDILAKRASDLTTRPLLPKHDCATTIEPNDVERVLTDINADYGNRTLCCRSHGVLIILAALASLSLAGQEHGRTIPLPDSRLLGFAERNLRDIQPESPWINPP